MDGSLGNCGTERAVSQVYNRPKFTSFVTPNSAAGENLAILPVDQRKQEAMAPISNTSPFLKQGDFPHPIQVDDSTWVLSTRSDGTKEILITLAKARGSNWWAHIVTSAPKIDTTKIVPENSKLSELDGETRGMVEKYVYNPPLFLKYILFFYFVSSISGTGLSLSFFSSAPTVTVAGPRVPPLPYPTLTQSLFYNLMFPMFFPVILLQQNLAVSFLTRENSPPLFFM